MESNPVSVADKIELMMLAADDPLFLADLKQVYDDFEGIA